MKSAKFKDSPLGPIPQDWEVKRLGDVWARFSTGPFGSALHASDYVEDGTPVVNPMHILDGKIVPSKDMRINDETLNRLSSYRLRKNDIILGRRGEMGRAALVTAKEDGWLCGTGSFSITLDSSVSPDYIALYIRTPNCITAMENGAIGTTIPNLNQAIVSNIPIALPPLPEQQSIAEALGEVDKLIESLDEQIEKKRLIAKGVAHDLLSGKKRLPGFAGEWRCANLGTLVDFITDTIATEEIDMVKYVSTDNMLPNLAGVAPNKTVVPYASVREFKRGDILLSNIRPYLKKMWFADYDAGCSTDVLVLRVVADLIDSRFLYRVLARDTFFEFVSAKAVGTKMPRGDKRVIAVFQVPIPQLAEQQAIADLLSEQDAAIAALEEKREKYVRIKDGMMRDLLTGQVRMKGE